MAAHIQKQWSALKQQDTLRREMVANISHDLRTPLALIAGVPLIVIFTSVQQHVAVEVIGCTACLMLAAHASFYRLLIKYQIKGNGNGEANRGQFCYFT